MNNFWSKVDIKGDDECWEWTGCKDRDGYGLFNLKKRVVRSHRFVYSLENDIKKGQHICHTCDNPSCVNPKHLWQGTSQENHLDKLKKKRHRHKISEALANKIRTDSGTYQSIAEKYSISINSVWRCKKFLHRGF